jgi:hypothetical protein
MGLGPGTEIEPCEAQCSGRKTGTGEPQIWIRRAEELGGLFRFDATRRGEAEGTVSVFAEGKERGDWGREVRSQEEEGGSEE